MVQSSYTVRSWLDSSGVAAVQAVMKILKQCYGDNKEAVSDELVQFMVDPGLQVGQQIPSAGTLSLPVLHPWSAGSTSPCKSGGGGVWGTT